MNTKSHNSKTVSAPLHFIATFIRRWSTAVIVADVLIKGRSCDATHVTFIPTELMVHSSSYRARFFHIECTVSQSTFVRNPTGSGGSRFFEAVCDGRLELNATTCSATIKKWFNLFLCAGNIHFNMLKLRSAAASLLTTARRMRAAACKTGHEKNISFPFGI